MSGGAWLPLHVHAITYMAQDILSLDLRSPDRDNLPGFSAGAHVDLALPGGMVRSYSLVNPETERHRYLVAVSRDKFSRGGSAYLCGELRVGDAIRVSQPRNHFPLQEEEGLSVLIAGGIGITPVWSMIQSLERNGRDWALHFRAKSRKRSAFLDEVSALETQRPGRVALSFSDEPGTARLDMAMILADYPPNTHFYCCGPANLLRDFEVASGYLDQSRIHKEYFAAAEAPAMGGFEVVLARSGRTLTVPPEKSILQTLRAENIHVAFSCQSGVCGACETEVLEGEPEHRDQVLSDRERASNKKMMICVSGCTGRRLVLDL